MWKTFQMFSKLFSSFTIKFVIFRLKRIQKFAYFPLINFDKPYSRRIHAPDAELYNSRIPSSEFIFDSLDWRITMALRAQY